MADPRRDIWSEWLLSRRVGGDPTRLEAVQQALYPVRDRVLSHVGLGDDGSLLDVGCGDGLIAFGALEQFPGCRVIFSDISDALLGHVRMRAEAMDVRSRCRFLRASADDLSALDAESVDAVTTRSVLIYVPRKPHAFREFHRVLRPRGRLSIFEPINRFGHPEPPDAFLGCDVTPVMALAQRVKAVFRRIQPDTDPMLDFDERDLFALAERAGFSEVHLELDVEVKPREPMGWEAMARGAGNPKIPTVEEAIRQALTPDEAKAFVDHLRPLVEAGRGVSRSAVAYLWALK